MRVDRANSQDRIRTIIGRLDCLYQEGRALTDPVCVRLSQELDQLILDWYRMATQSAEGDSQ